MLDSQGFDLWAGNYDDSVRRAERTGEYPFAGYSELMNAVYGTVMKKAPAGVLDVGIGTAVLSKKLYDAGCGITGMDFSAEMLTIARQKMPRARLIQWDFTRGVPPALESEIFDFIISTYALHHLEDDIQAQFIRALLALLKPEGVMLIGDVSFLTDTAMLACMDASEALWDDEEHYPVVSRLRPKLVGYDVSFHAFSFCSGVMEIRREVE